VFFLLIKDDDEEEEEEEEKKGCISLAYVTLPYTTTPSPYS